MRTESDFIGSLKVPDDALYGINALRAKNNFPVSEPFHIEWYKAVGLVKMACYLAYKEFKKALTEKYSKNDFNFPLIEDDIIESLISTALEVSNGCYFEHFIVPSVQGGAGTSINMNINEIISNASLLKLGKNPGRYDIIDPIQHANVFQSTNDVIPTALKLCVMQLLSTLEQKINEMRSQVEKIESSHRNTMRTAYTQMMEAVPSSYGMLFSTYNEALSRDWWRVSKCFERIKTVNLGGGAIGTGISIPRFFIYEVNTQLQRLSGLPLTRSENLPDATANKDDFVEVHAILKTHAVNLEKMASDLRLLASDININRELTIPQKQLGSSIMPGKVNPVISEFVVSVSQIVFANDMLISSLCAKSCLDLNAYLPLIGHHLIQSVKFLMAADQTLSDNLFAEVKIDGVKSYHNLIKNPSVTTALNPYIGYRKASEIAVLMKERNCDIFEANKMLSLIDENKLKTILEPQNLLKMGYAVKDIQN
ncbi:MAG: lyase family protein [Bacteroidales bacterium]|nr:lyase family protein [Bacteroidales bacterium]